MPLVGNLRDFALHDFLYLVDRGYKTGSLHLDRATASDAAHLFFDKGKLLTAIRPQRRERLGELLIRLGKIEPAQLAQALHHQQHNDYQPLGQILVLQGAIGQRELQACIQQQIEETVYDLFAWREGEFKFLAGQRPAPDDVQSLVPLPVENIIMEGVRRVDELSRIRGRIPHNDVVVRFVERANDRPANVNMSADEWRVFARINGRATITEIADKTGLTAFQVSNIVYGFIDAGLVEVQAMPSTPHTGATAEAQAQRAANELSRRASASNGEIELPRNNLVNRVLNRFRGG